MASLVQHSFLPPRAAGAVVQVSVHRDRNEDLAFKPCIFIDPTLIEILSAAPIFPSWNCAHVKLLLFWDFRWTPSCPVDAAPHSVDSHPSPPPLCQRHGQVGLPVSALAAAIEHCRGRLVSIPSSDIGIGSSVDSDVSSAQLKRSRHSVLEGPHSTVTAE